MLNVPHLTGGREVSVTASIGISMYPDHGQDAEGLLHSADVAMYEAKKRGGATYRFVAAWAEATPYNNDV